MKKTTQKPIFSNGSECFTWVEDNCACCRKFRANALPTCGDRPSTYKCAIQRDIEMQYIGVQEVYQRSYDAVQQGRCPYIDDNSIPRSKVKKHRNIKGQTEIKF